MTELDCGCGHTWNYTGNLSDHTTCPTCSRSVKIPSSDDDSGFKTPDDEEEIQRLKERVDTLEKTVDRLLKRIKHESNDRDERGCKTDTVDTDDDKDKNNGFYDPTSGF